MRLRALILLSLLTCTLHAQTAIENAAASTPPASIAPASINIDQFKQKLASPPVLPAAEGSVPMALLQDSNQATWIDGMQLSERLTATTLTGILAQHTFGQQTQHALELLADRSALLDPPASELPDKPAPDASRQEQMLEAARAFVFQRLTHLPNFFATRTTARFFGVPPELNASGLPVQLGLRPRGSFSREITYREGKELINPMKSPRPAPTLPQVGLETWGEFGPEPAMILMDSGAGTIAFHHWENGPSGAVAVFRYSVPEAESHYDVNYACNGSTSFHAQPAYHGSLAVDPASGAILRVTIQADWKKDDPISHVASVVEYGPVEIGGRSYICPLNSLAFSVEEPNLCSRNIHNRSQVQPMLLNRTAFTDYHRIGSTSRIVTDPNAVTQAPQK